MGRDGGEIKPRLHSILRDQQQGRLVDSETISMWRFNMDTSLLLEVEVASQRDEPPSLRTSDQVMLHSRSHKPVGFTPESFAMVDLAIAWNC